MLLVCTFFSTLGIGLFHPHHISSFSIGFTIGLMNIHTVESHKYSYTPQKLNKMGSQPGVEGSIGGGYRGVLDPLGSPNFHQSLVPQLTVVPSLASDKYPRPLYHRLQALRGP